MHILTIVSCVTAWMYAGVVVRIEVDNLSLEKVLMFGFKPGIDC